MKGLRIVLCMLAILIVSGKIAGQVKIYREPLTLPTYGVMAPEIMPDWDENRYPYTMLDRLTNVRGSRTYNALYIENEFVKALILPEIGGRLHGAKDKTNGYEFLYNQTVIKPALVGITGAWISGGIEWNFPIGHRPTGFRDTDWTLVENPDSSKTVWVGEAERLTGMRWSVGTTVHPHRNWVETRVRLYNCTPFIQRFQYWATSAVRATENYQAVIPGEIMTGHEKKEFYHWPVNNGVDISYWKNTQAATSYFAVDSRSDFFGGYSPEANAGMVHVADHHIVRGKKLWTWGTAPAGRLWEKLLTDGDLPYFEPQAGAYSDNQPSLFWIMPGETKTFSHFWFPVRDIGVFDYANLEGSLRLKAEDNQIRFGWSPTGINKGAVVILTSHGAELFRKSVDADPSSPFNGMAEIPANYGLYDIGMHVLAALGDTLLSFKHERPLNPPLPNPMPETAPETEMTSTDALFLAGDKFNRYNETARARKYYNEAIRRDPGDVRSNTTLGIMAMKDGLFAEAIGYFNRATDRDEDYFEAIYNRGLAQDWHGNLKEAVINLSRSSYAEPFFVASYQQLAAIYGRMHNPEKALACIEKGIQGHVNTTGTLDASALLHYQLGDWEQACRLAGQALETDPLNHFAQAILFLSCNRKDPGGSVTALMLEKLLSLTRLDNENHLALAIQFARFGSYNEAIRMLDFVTEPKSVGISPLSYYHKAYYNSLAGNPGKPDELILKASSTSPAYCFPNRLEDMMVLEWALQRNPEDGLASYLLGNFLYSHSRKEEAIRCWEKSVAVYPKNAVAYRNLGVAYQEVGELEKARMAYQSAIRIEPTAGMAIVELGRLNKELKLPVADQIRLFEENTKVVAAYNQAANQLIELYVITERYEDALKWLKSIHFNSWEGQYDIHQLWEQSNIKQGDIEFAKGNFAKALDCYRLSLTYPENLEVAEQPNAIHARNNYKIGNALMKKGEKTVAREYYLKVISDSVDIHSAFQIYRGQAYEALGEADKAHKIYAAMLEEQPAHSTNNRNIATGMFCRSLALGALGKQKEAADLRKAAMELYPLVEINAFRPTGSDY